MQTPKEPAAPPSPIPVPLDVRNFRKLPVEIQAVKMVEGNIEEIAVWIREHGHEATAVAPYWLRIETLEGQLTAKVGCWVVRGTAGEFYPVDAEIFKGIYEEI